MDTSPTIGNLAKALSQAQGAFKPIKRESVNPFYKSKYADLGTIIEATKDALSKNGLAICQLPVPNTIKVDGEERVYLDTVLIHESGEWIKCAIALIPKADDPQAIGSAMTYARRYSLGAILGVASEDDDDGNAATKPEQAKVDTPTLPQVNAIAAYLTKLNIMEDHDRAKKVSDLLGLTEIVTSTKKLTREQAAVVCKALAAEVEATK
jgi:hypothetical protein